MSTRTGEPEARSATPKEDVWVHSACDMCFSACGILAHRVNGVIVKIEGDPNCPLTNGRLCAKGQAGLMGVYDPNRVRTPLKRTNTEKGVGVEPGWVEITWEEAQDTVAEKLRKVRQEDPRRLVIATFDTDALFQLIQAWASAFGTPNTGWQGYYCGNYLHSTMYLTNGTFHSDFDVGRCNYVILLGNQMGFGVGLNPNIVSQKMAEARLRGMKVVSVDPVGSNAASKADEWLPIRPGTDGAFILAIINLLLNEYGLYDAPFLQQHTNAPYIVGPDGYYLRDPASGKPLVWDRSQGRAVPFDQGREPALEGGYTVAGAPCHPAFHLLKEHVRDYTPERASEVTTIPAATIRRVAREFGEQARIGSTIVIDGVELPYRPVAVNIYRGAGAHKHGALTGLAVQTLNMIVGAFYVPGGHRGENLVGPSGAWAPAANPDGMVLPPEAVAHHSDYYNFEVRSPESLHLAELFPISSNRSPMNELSTLEGQRFKLPYEPEVLIQQRRNLMMNDASIQSGAEMLRRIPFVVSFAALLDETAEFADIVLPDTHSLERLDLFPNRMIISVSMDSGYFYWGVRQPVAAPAAGVRSFRDVMLELAERLGFLEDVYQALNLTLRLKEGYRLTPGGKYTWENIFDRWARSEFGEERGLEWFKQNGYYKVKRSVTETYPLPKVSARFPLYFENIKRAGELVKAVTEELDIPWDTSDYQTLPDWKPCPGFSPTKEGYDLYAVQYKVPFHFQSWTTENPWLNEVGERHPYAYKVMVNTETARRKGIKDGDPIWVESSAGRVRGEAKVTQCVHPEVVGIAGAFGSWAHGKPVARGKGVHFNTLVPIDLEHIDSISAGVDACVRVRISKAQ